MSYRTGLYHALSIAGTVSIELRPLLMLLSFQALRTYHRVLRTLLNGSGRNQPHLYLSMSLEEGSSGCDVRVALGDNLILWSGLFLICSDALPEVGHRRVLGSQLEHHPTFWCSRLSSGSQRDRVPGQMHNVAEYYNLLGWGL